MTPPPEIPSAGTVETVGRNLDGLPTSTPEDLRV